MKKHAGKKSLKMDISEIRRNARSHIEEGAITPSYGSDRRTVLRLLNEALATELVCHMRYRSHYFMAKGIHSQAVATEFLQHANEELAHVDLLAERIIQLGGKPNFNPLGILDRSHAEFVDASKLVDMIKENLIAERVAIESYMEMIRYIGSGDPTSRRILESILEKEEEHAEDLITLFESYEPEEVLAEAG